MELKPSSLFNKYAQTYADKYMDVSKYQDSLDLFCKTMPYSGADILDVACGPGNITKYILGRRPKDQILGIDLAPEMLKIARQINPSATFQNHDAKHINTLEESFDGIICAFGLPYLSKEEAIQFIQQASKALNTNGLLYISTMEGKYDDSKWLGPSSGGDEKLFTYYHESEHLLSALSKNNFKPLDVSRVSTKKEDGSITTDLIIIAQKQ